MCIVQLGGKTNGAVVAYDLASGGEKWKWTGEGAAYASPVEMTVGGTKLIVTQTDKSVIALVLADGKLAWETPYVGHGMGAGNFDTPIVDGQTIIYTGQGRGTTAIKLNEQDGAFTATGLWTNTDVSPRFCTPVLKDGFLYGLSEKGKFYCIDAKTGKTAWTEAEGARGNFGSIVDAGSVLIALTPKSHLIVFQPSDKEFSLLANIKVADKPTYPQPVVSGNRVFVEDDDSVALLTVD
jgi:outer membrane protein assembly factor BamB